MKRLAKREQDTWESRADDDTSRKKTRERAFLVRRQRIRQRMFKGLFPKRVFAAVVENIKLQIDIEIPFMRASIFDKAPQGSKK